jgi:hypothetical protein
MARKDKAKRVTRRTRIKKGRAARPIRKKFPVNNGARGNTTAAIPAVARVATPARIPMSASAEALHQWMNKKANSHGREAILMHRLCFDLQIAAARRDYYLNTYRDDVDHDGFDLIFDDQDSIKKTQVKTVNSRVPTGRWDIHKRILRPTLEHVEKLGFEPSQEGQGVEGSFILMQFDTSKPDIAVNYFYTDVYVCLAFEHEIVRRRHASSRKAIARALRSLRRGSGDERVTVPKALMLQARGPAELLALSGLHGPSEAAWQWHVSQIVNQTGPDPEPKMEFAQPLPEMKRVTAEEIRALVADDDLLDGSP